VNAQLNAGRKVLKMEKNKQKYFFPVPSRMMNIHNAVSDTLAEMDMNVDAHIHEENGHYVVTFQSRQNGNNKIVMKVTYTVTHHNDVLDDDDWDETVEVELIEHPGFRQTSAELLLEYLASTIDPDEYYNIDSDSEDESDDDASTISQPLTPPPSRVRRA
jgi:hypothetical protein